MLKESVIMETKREMDLAKELNGAYLEKWVRDNKDLKQKIERLDTFLKNSYKEEVKEYISYLYNGSECGVHSLSDEIRLRDAHYNYEMECYGYGYRKQKPEYQDLGSYLREKVEEKYNKVFHDVEKIELSEEDIKYLNDNASKHAYDTLLYAVEEYNKNKANDFNGTTEIRLCHTWDINHSNGRFDTLIFGESMDVIETILEKYGFRRRERELDRKCVLDTFTTNY